MSAYNEIYLYDAMKNLGEAFDYVVNSCNKSADEFVTKFIVSGVADNYEKGNPKYVSGMSGTELVMDVFELTGEEFSFPSAQTEYECSSEYWVGWSLAFYQWKTGKSFREIFKHITMTDLLKLYPTLHEASEEKFVDTLSFMIERHGYISKLQQQRKVCGYSQRELAEKSGVNIRTLQQYEIGSKDIGKAAVQVVLAMANVLGCKVEDLV